MRRKPKYNYLMARRLTCGSCGARVPGFPSHSVTSKKVNLYYQCRATHDEYVRECTLQKSFRAGEVDAAVWGWVKTLLLDPAALAHGLEDYQDEQARRNAPLTERVKVIDGLLADNRAQLGRLLDLYLAGEFAKELLTERKIKLEATIGALERERANLATHLKAQTLTEEQIRTLQDFAGQVSTALAAAEANFAVRRQLIEMLNVEGTLALEEGEKVVYVRCLLTGPDIGPDRYSYRPVVLPLVDAALPDLQPGVQTGDVRGRRGGKLRRELCHAARGRETTQGRIIVRHLLEKPPAEAVQQDQHHGAEGARPARKESVRQRGNTRRAEQRPDAGRQGGEAVLIVGWTNERWDRV